MWKDVAHAPFDRDLELAVIDGDGPHTLVFPCRRVLRGWVRSDTREPVEVRPTHWREWKGTLTNLLLWMSWGIELSFFLGQ